MTGYRNYPRWPLAMTLPVSLSSAPLLEPARLAELDRLLEGLDAVSLGFVAGYATARARGTGSAAAAPTGPAPSHAAGRTTVLFGSQTGNARRLAERLGQQLAGAGVPARVVNMADYPLKDLSREQVLIVFISTQGDGDPPDDARGFLEFLASRRAPRLDHLSYGVYALGDSSYPKFCVTGRQLDERLATLGARATLTRLDADGEPEAETGAWLDRAVEASRTALGSDAVASIPTLRLVPTTPAGATRASPAEVEVLANHPVTDRNAAREVRHIELGFKSGALHYEPGDALGIPSRNAPATVERVAKLLKVDGEERIEVASRSLSLREWLTSEREITRLTRPFVEAHAARSGSATLRKIVQPGSEHEFRTLVAGSQVVDLLAEFPAEWTARELVAALKPMSPRLYSIASSPAAVDDEVHLCVALVEDVRNGFSRPGAASGFLAREGVDGALLRAYVEPNERFRLPRDGGTDIIMIGAGTGIAPYRAFLQHRRELGHAGRNWLFFGARHRDRDFLYQTEWQEALKGGALHRIDLAFSRDQEAKVYVQDRLRERAADVWAWLESGAALYVCGDAAGMAPGVHEALLSVIRTQGGLSLEGAEAYVTELVASRRYLRDVY